MSFPDSLPSNLLSQAFLPEAACVQVVPAVLGPNSSPKPCCVLSRSLGAVPCGRLEDMLSCSLHVEHQFCSVGCVQSSCTSFSEMVLGLELQWLDEESFPQEAETSAAEFRQKPAVEPHLQPQQKHRDTQAGDVQAVMKLEHRLESTTVGGCAWVTVT